MSERHLRRRFVAVAGMSPHDYLMRLRLQLARQLMEETPGAWRASPARSGSAMIANSGALGGGSRADRPMHGGRAGRLRAVRLIREAAFFHNSPSHC